MSNKTFMCLLRSENGACEKPSATEMELMYAKYQEWQQKFADNIADMGNKLGEVGSVIRQDSVKDGPYVETKEIIGGYMTITANTLEEAITVIQESPMITNPGVSIEIREVCIP